MNYLVAASAPLGQMDSYVTSISGALLTLLGLNYYALVWAFVGALVALTKGAKMTRGRAVFYVLLSTSVGSLLGTAAADQFGITARSAIAIMALLGGMGWQGITATLLVAFNDRLKAVLPSWPWAPPAPPALPPPALPPPPPEGKT